MIEVVVVVLHHACWQQLIGFVVEDVVQFSSLELSKMWRQHLDELQTVLGKVLNFLGISSCNDSCSRCPWIGWRINTYLRLSIQIAIHYWCSSTQFVHYVFSCQYDEVCQDYMMDLICLDKVQIGEWPYQFAAILPLRRKKLSDTSISYFGIIICMFWHKWLKPSVRHPTKLKNNLH